jgi:hypothetical protein
MNGSKEQENLSPIPLNALDEIVAPKSQARNPLRQFSLPGFAAKQDIVKMPLGVFSQK